MVRLVLMDMEFEKIKDNFDKVEVNTTAAREHVGEIERGIVQFLVTFSRDIRLFTAEFPPSRTAKQLSSSLKNTVKFYARGGFVVRLVLMDMEFEKINDNFDKVEVNNISAREHVGEIERGISLMK